jgi:hypothetical protein
MRKMTRLKLVRRKAYIYFYYFFYYYYFDNPGCPGQLARTTTIPRVYWTSCKPSRQVRHRGGDMRAHGGSNSGRVQGKPHLLTTELDPQVHIFFIIINMDFWISLRTPQLISRVLKLTTIYISLQWSWYLWDLNW